MKIIRVKFAKREFPLAFTMDALAAIEDMIPDFNIANLGEYSRNPRTLCDMLYCLAQQGSALEGKTLDVDRAWIGSHLSPAPAQTAKIQIAVLNALAEGMKMETEEEEQGEVDVTLEEIKKNETKGD